jgi:phage recombination protein Bet
MSLVPQDLAGEVRRLLAPGASAAECDAFALVCRHLELDPFAGEIYLINYGGQWRHQISQAGRLVIAQRTGRFQGIEGPFWTGPRDPKTMELHWRDLWDEDTTPYAARAIVHVKHWKAPVVGTAKFIEFNTGSAIWKQKPAHMLAKVAISLCLRLAFSEVQTALRDAGRPMDFSWPSGQETAEDDTQVLEAEAVAELPSEPQSAKQEPPPLPPHPDEVLTPAQDRLITTMLDELGLTLSKLAVGVTGPVKELTPAQARTVIEALKSEARTRASRNG